MERYSKKTDPNFGTNGPTFKSSIKAGGTLIPLGEIPGLKSVEEMAKRGRVEE